MQRIDGPTRSASLPAPAATGAGAASPGYFGHGNPGTQTPATTLTVDWANMIQEELIAVVLAGGLTPDKANNGQVLAALRQLFVAKAAGGSGGGSAGSGIDPANGEFAFNGGGFCKVGKYSGTLGEGSNTIVFHTPFPTACLSLQLTAIDANASALRDFTMQVVSMSASGFTAMVQKNGSDGSNIDGFTWDAKGY